MEDKLIGATFKVLAKTFVAVADTDRLKKENTGKLARMDEEKFRKRYAKVYEVIKDLPPELKASCNITENMSKKQAIKNIQSFDRKNIYNLINSIPDTFIAKQFKGYLNEKKLQMQKSGLVEQINKLWNKMIEKANKPAR